MPDTRPPRRPEHRRRPVTSTSVRRDPGRGCSQSEHPEIVPSALSCSSSAIWPSLRSFGRTVPRQDGLFRPPAPRSTPRSPGRPPPAAAAKSSGAHSSVWSRRRWRQGPRRLRRHVRRSRNLGLGVVHAHQARRVEVVLQVLGQTVEEVRFMQGIPIRVRPEVGELFRMRAISVHSGTVSRPASCRGHDVDDALLERPPSSIPRTSAGNGQGAEARQRC